MSVRLAWVWLVALCLVGLVVLLQLGTLAKIVALASLALVAAYPFMKRITWWPQAWLGLCFHGRRWSVGRGGGSRCRHPLWLLYAGSIFWVIGYDTIYALQDREDDALIGMRSTRCAWVRGCGWAAGFYLLALAVLGGGDLAWCVPQWLALVALCPSRCISAGR